MSLLNLIGQSAAKKAQLATLKLGKSYEQKKAIDFFLKEDSGCGGCLSKISGISMDEYLEMVQNKVNSIDHRKNAIRKIGLDESEIREIDPVSFSSFVYDDDVYINVNDTTAVSSQFSISWIFFSTTQIYTYQYIFDMTSDDSWEITKDFFYRDITCFQTEHNVKEKITIGISGCIKKNENASKNNYVVDTLDIIVPNNKFSFSMRNSPEMERSVQAAKAMLREKKFS